MLFDYPAVIRNLRKQLPPAERNAFISDYKKLSEEDKNKFKNFLKAQDTASAGAMLGRDFSRVQTTPAPSPKPVEEPVAQVFEGPAANEFVDGAFPARIKQILEMGAPDIDRSLVAEAAKVFDKLPPLPGADVAARARQITAVAPDSGQQQTAQVARVYEKNIPDAAPVVIRNIDFTR